MAAQRRIYKCQVCETVAEVLEEFPLELVCCGRTMTPLAEKATCKGKETHAPRVTRQANAIKVSVGTIPHPMAEDHFIEWIELTTEEKCYRQFLQPDQMPEAVFDVAGDDVRVRAYCSRHGLWTTEESAAEAPSDSEVRTDLSLV